MPGDQSRKAQAGSFGLAAAEYDQARPSYPDQAVDWLLPPKATRVVEVGAGTGQLTRRLVARGLDVTAVEPLTEMRAVLSGRLPQVKVLGGRAEALPLDSDSVDAVLVAQAWHWFERERAVSEIARVLRPRGQLGLVWNIRDERTPWVAELGRLIRDYGDPNSELEMGSEQPIVGEPFGTLQRKDLTWTRRLEADELVALIASRSSVITMTAAEREQLLEAVRDLAGRQQSTPHGLELPYITRCSRTTLPNTRT